MCKYQERKPTWQDEIHRLEDETENAESKAEFDRKMDELIAAKEEKTEKSKNSEKEWFEKD